MSNSTKNDISMALVIIAFAVAQIAIGGIWGVRIAANVACRNLGYESGRVTNLFSSNMAVVCESSHDIAIPDMWRGP